jgi:hypothetical protein
MRTDQGGGWVAPAGSQKSYTGSPQKARVFETLADAEANRCPDNEIIFEYYRGSLRPILGEEVGDNAQ